MTSHMIFLQFNSTFGVESIEHFFEVSPNCNFSKRQIFVVLSLDPARDFFYSRWASPPNQPGRGVSTRLAIYIEVYINDLANVFR